MRQMEFKMERTGLLEVGDVLPVDRLRHCRHPELYRHSDPER